MTTLIDGRRPLSLCWRPLEQAHALLAVSIVMAYLLARDLGAPKWVASAVCLGMALGLLFLR